MRFFFSIALLVNTSVTIGQSKPDAKMDWFANAKLGIFVHWGIYAVNGIDESWAFHNNYLPYANYMKQLDGFTADRYDPARWAELIKQSGARYAVLTTKHHDGVALWPTKLSALNTVEKTPARRDLATPLVEALRKQNLKVGLYYSLLDWSDDRYDGFTKSEKRYDITKEPARWNRFVQFYQGQLRELTTAYRPDLWWFDGDWEHKAEEWKAAETRKLLLDSNPGVILNSRLMGHGDYGTPEQDLPLERPKDKYWELCMTMNESWGYQPSDKNYKTSIEVIQIFAECISKGGNMLLGIGPKADGTIPDEQTNILKDLGRWTNKHSEAIYGTREGLPNGYFYGPSSTLSADSTILYLFLPYKPTGSVMLKGVKNRINRVWVVGNGTKPAFHVRMRPYWSQNAGLLFIDVPAQALDEQMTVLAVLLDGKLRLQQ